MCFQLSVCIRRHPRLQKTYVISNPSYPQAYKSFRNIHDFPLLFTSASFHIFKAINAYSFVCVAVVGPFLAIVVGPFLAILESTWLRSAIPVRLRVARWGLVWPGKQ